MATKAGIFFPMKSTIVSLTLLCLLPVVFCAKKTRDLSIETQHKPDTCYEVAELGDEVYVHYTGFLSSGQIFDTSRQPERGPLPFVLGAGRVIPGWEQGIQGMCIGERRKLTIPPHLAYGKAGHPPAIPPEETLVFETELVSINKKSTSIDVFGLVRFLALPTIAGYIIYYLYDKYKKEQVEIKEERKRKKKH